MMNTIKRKISVLLAAVMLFSTMPVFAMDKIAENDEWHTWSDSLFNEDFEKEFTWGKTATGTATIAKRIAGNSTAGVEKCLILSRFPGNAIWLVSG